jgi:hypothetical protein
VELKSKLSTVDNDEKLLFVISEIGLLFTGIDVNSNIVVDDELYNKIDVDFPT